MVLLVPVAAVVDNGVPVKLGLLNVGLAVDLISCAVLIVTVFEVPVIVTPFVLVKLILPFVGIAEPLVPIKLLADVLALL
jgi:hypothetical protein